VANIFEPSEEQKMEWAEFVATRPPNVRKIAGTISPWKLYRLKSTGHRVTIYSFDEHKDGTVTCSVVVSGEYNTVLFARRVFGIKPSDLEECDIPTNEQALGEVLSPEQVEGNIDMIRVLVRPDLFVLDEAGKAVRKQ